MHAGQLRYHVSNDVSYVQEMELLLFIVLGEVVAAVCIVDIWASGNGKNIYICNDAMREWRMK